MMRANIASEQELSRTWQVFQRFQNGRECTVAVDQEIDGAQPSSASRRREEAEARGTAGGATCRRGASAAGVVVDGEGPGQQLGGGGVAGDGPQRWCGAVAELLAMELELLLRRLLGE